MYVPSIGKIFALGEYLNASSFMSSASGVENIRNLKAFDSSGNEITADFDSAAGTASFSEEPHKVTYDYDTGFNGIMMDVTVYATGEPETVEAVGSSGGGCNSAFGIMTLAGMVMLLRKRR